MQILYLSWGEITKDDCLSFLKNLGSVVTLSIDYDYFSNIKDLNSLFQEHLEKGSFDCIFSFNYFPAVSRIASTYQVAYLSYIYDSPLFTLYNKAILSPFNYFFVFDSGMCDELRSMGAKHVYYLPLPVNPDRMGDFLSTPTEYLHNISFVGGLYSTKENFYYQISGISNDTSAALDNLINEQIGNYHTNFLNDIPISITDELVKKVELDLKSDYFLTKESFVKKMILPKLITGYERRSLIKVICQIFPFDLYTYSPEITDELLNIHNLSVHPEVKYKSQMPNLFHKSKINLNISLRSIQQGIPLRCLDILAAGGFLLTNYQKDMCELFEENKDFVCYRTKDELLEKIAYYLEHEEERKLIAKSGQEKVFKLCSYETQLNTLFSIFEKERCKKLPLSICLIAKNEEKHVINCLSPLNLLGAEIIFVDTGSTDKTVEHATNYTSHIYHFPFNNNFSDARNFSISKATNPYILVMDLDEYLELPDDIVALRNTLLQVFEMDTSKHTLFTFTRSNVMADEEASIMIEQVPRLFHKDFFHYEGSIHEQIKPLCQTKDATRYSRLPFHVTHVGYRNPNVLVEKAQRDLHLLELEFQKNPNDPYTLFQLGQAEKVLKNYEQAISYYDTCLSIDIDENLEYVQTMIESYGYCLLETGQIEQALSLEGVYDVFKKRADFVFLMGLIYMNATMFDRAIEEFINATKISDCQTIGTNSFKAWYNAGVIYECSNRPREAIDCYKKCGDYEKAKSRLAELIKL